MFPKKLENEFYRRIVQQDQYVSSSLVAGEKSR